MEFNQKLDYLMKFTNTTNSILAQYISLDASFVGRLRSGVLPPVMEAGYIRAMASYFAVHCAAKRQTKELLATMIKNGSTVRASEKLEDPIIQWLSCHADNERKRVDVRLDNPSLLSSIKSPIGKNQADSNPDSPITTGTEIYYGTEGRRKASIQILCEVLKLPTPCTLLLLSDEKLDWMSENHDFMATWAALLQQVLLRGNRIKIVHHVHRSLDDLIVAINQWMPIYMSGIVEPFFNPEIRAVFFQRSLLIAPGCAAIISNSVTGGSENIANYLVRDKKAIEAATSEFDDYCSFCRPFLRSSGAEKIYESVKRIEEFETVMAETILATNALAALPIPIAAVELSTYCLAPDKREPILSYYKKRQEHFEDLLSKTGFHIIINTPDCKTHNKRLRPLICSSLMSHKELIYTEDMIKLQLDYLCLLLKCYDNFHIYLTDNKMRDEYIIYAKADIGVMISAVKQPANCFEISENNVTAAYWNYLRNIVGASFCSHDNKKQSIRKIKSLLRELQNDSTGLKPHTVITSTV